MLSRRSALTAATLSTIAVSGCGAGDDGGRRGGRELLRAPFDVERLGAPLSTFVSTPDFFNGDVGDLSTLPRWDGGENSINDSWRTAIDTCLAAVSSHRPQAVLVAGDLVEGRWNIDSTGRELFGPVSQGTDPRSLAQCRDAITTASNVYYGHYTSMFASRGLRLLPAVGDHEILDDRGAPDLDDRWSPSGRLLSGEREGEPDNRYFLVPHAKQTWARHFTTTAAGRPRHASRPVSSQSEHTAYAVDLGPALRVITVDVFDHTIDGVRLGVYGRQLQWLRRSIRSAKREGRVVVVQGHIPILRPYRKLATGNLRVPQGTDSGLYRVLLEEGADFYFSGEVHDTTAQQLGHRGPVQLSHGTIFRYAFNFVVGRVYAGGTTVLDYFEMTVERRSRTQDLWCSDEEKRQPTMVEYGATPRQRGRLVTRNRRILERTDKLGVYDRETDTLGYEGHLTPEMV